MALTLSPLLPACLAGATALITGQSQHPLPNEEMRGTSPQMDPVPVARCGWSSSNNYCSLSAYFFLLFEEPSLHVIYIDPQRSKCNKEKKQPQAAAFYCVHECVCSCMRVSRFPEKLNTPAAKFLLKTSLKYEMHQRSTAKLPSITAQHFKVE